jgi:hypothetical protein
MCLRDHRFDQDAMLASMEKLIQSGAGAGYARTMLVGHHMDWLFRDEPVAGKPILCSSRAVSR